MPHSPLYSMAFSRRTVICASWIKIMSNLLVLYCMLFLAGPTLAGEKIAPGEYSRFLIPVEAMTAEKDGRLPASRALEDVSVLRELFEQAYSGHEYFAKAGTDWSGIFASLEKEVSSKKDWAPEEFYGLLLAKFSSCGIRDNHFSMKLRLRGRELWRAPFYGHWTPYFSDHFVRRNAGRWYMRPRAGGGPETELLAVNGEAPGRFLFRTHEPGLDGETYLLGSFSASPLKELACEIRSGASAPERMLLSLHPSRAARNSARPVFEMKDYDGVAYISLGSMQDSHAAQLNRFVESAEALRGAKVILLDLRGNEGGRDGWGNAWLAGLTSGLLSGGGREINSLVSPATLQGGVNTLRESLASAPDPAAREIAGRRLAEAEYRLAEAGKARVRRHWEAKDAQWPGQAPQEFRGRLLVLADAQTASAGESLLWTARGLPGAAALGENTRGVNTFGPLYLYGLPNSGIKVYLAQGITLYGGELLESSGMSPDIWFDEPDQLPKALDYARGLLWLQRE